MPIKIEKGIYYLPQEAANYLSIKQPSISQAISEGRLKSIRFGIGKNRKTNLISKKELNRYKKNVRRGVK